MDREYKEMWRNKNERPKENESAGFFFFFFFIICVPSLGYYLLSLWLKSFTQKKTKVAKSPRSNVDDFGLCLCI